MPQTDVAFAVAGPELTFDGKQVLEQMRRDACILCGVQNDLVELILPAVDRIIGAEHVDAQALDRLLTRLTFSNAPRPALLPAQVNGLLKGFIDLVFMHEGRYYVADYKFNSLGSGDTAYTPEALAAAMLAKRYDLQASLYLLALHRQLKARLGAHYDYDTHIGGSLYLFLRGCRSPTRGRVFDKPPKALIEGLDKLFANGCAA